MFEIGRVSHTKPHLLADTVELALLFGDYVEISEADIFSIMSQSPRVDSELLDLSEEDLDDDGYDDSLSEAEISGRQQGYIEDCLAQIEYRVSVFGDYYPFEIDRRLIKIKNEVLDQHYLYISLLVCSRCRSFTAKGMKQRISDLFETVSYECLSRILSPLFKVYMFGPNTEHRKNYFGTNLRDAIPILVSELGMELLANWEENYSASGDSGIDLVGVCSFDENSPGNSVVIAQCAAQENERDWKRKRSEADIKYLSGSIHSICEPQAILFIPACFRNADGSWRNANDVSGILTIDRVRIVNVFSALNEKPEFKLSLNRIGLELAEI